MPRTRTESELREHIKANVKINANGCWIWQLYKKPNGYGMLSVWNGERLAHRLSYLVFKSAPKLLNVLHKCDTPACVNPDHLFLGTALDNSNDKISKKRNWTTKGEERINHKLTKNQVAEIRRLYNLPKSSQSAIAEMFGVSIRTIRSITDSQKWKSVSSEKITRKRIGSDRVQSKLTESDVIRILKMWTNSSDNKILAEKYGVHRSNIDASVRRKTWKHI